MLNLLMRMTVASLVLLTVVAAHGQQGQWAAANDATAKYMLDMERQWAEAACTHNGIAQRILADDFQGTAPEGNRYTKSEEVHNDDSAKNARDCRLDDAKVRFFGDKIAVVYGRERSIRKDKEGKETARCLVWTDTWLKAQ